jgi:hypothetical protein
MSITAAAAPQNTGGFANNESKCAPKSTLPSRSRWPSTNTPTGTPVELLGWL